MPTSATEQLAQQMADLSKALKSLSHINRVASLPPDRVMMFNHLGRLVRLYLPNALTDGVQGMILRHGTFFESGLLHEVGALGLIGPTATVLDIGANIGNHSVYFAHILGARHVYAFEPQEYCQEVLTRNVALNALETVTLVPDALGAQVGRASASRFKSANYGATAFSVDADGPVGLTTLDRWCADTGINAVDFIKIDVEGHAESVVTGAREMLTTHKPPIWVELLPRFDEAEPTLKKLEALGYSVFRTLSRVDYLLHHADRPIAD